MFWWVLVEWKIWKLSIYVHLCCIMGDILIIQIICVEWKFEKCLCPFMLQYGWHCDNSKKIKKTPSRIEKSMYTPGVFYVHCFFKSGRCPKTVFQFYILCSGTSLYIKRMEFEVPKRLPPRVAKFQAIIALTNVWCSIFYVWVSAADSWWQPKQASKEKERQG